jgi:serine/threonine protein kinase
MSFNPQPRYSVEALTADLSLLDITGYVRLDPQYRFAIGCGAGGDVYRALYEWPDSRTLQVCSVKVVVKVLKGTSAQQHRIEQRVKREVAAWRYLNHPNVAKFLGIAYVQPGRPPGLVSRFMQRNDFLAYIGRHSDLKREKALEVARGLQYLHSKNIVHGDLRVDNVLVSDNGVAQLNDFGISHIMDVQGFTTKIMRNIRFTAPELMPITEMTSEIHPTFQSDIFSLAILLLQLFHGPDRDLQSALPYNHVRLRSGTDYDFRLLRRIHEGERPIRERYRTMFDQHWILLTMCWQGDPFARPDITYVVNAL